MNRRSFIYNSTGMLLTLPSFANERKSKYIDNLGIQLYSLRKPLNENLKSTIEEVKKIGYKQVEPYNFPSSKSLEMISRARDHGMQVNSSHFQWDSLLSPKTSKSPNFEKILEIAHKNELTDLVVPYLHTPNRSNLEAYKKTADQLNKGAIQAKEAGIRLSYHNHAFEFQPLSGGKTGFDVLTRNFSEDMFFELDVFWVKVGGVNPVAQINFLKGRISQLHLKDLRKGFQSPNFEKVSPDDFAEIGAGQIPMHPILKAANLSGVKHCHAEQDHSPAPLSSMEKSFDFLNG